TATSTTTATAPSNCGYGRTRRSPSRASPGCSATGACSRIPHRTMAPAPPPSKESLRRDHRRHAVTHAARPGHRLPGPGAEPGAHRRGAGGGRATPAVPGDPGRQVATRAGPRTGRYLPEPEGRPGDHQRVLPVGVLHRRGLGRVVGQSAVRALPGQPWRGGAGQVGALLPDLPPAPGPVPRPAGAVAG